MSVNLDPLKSVGKLLFEIELKPLQGFRFQPTGFPSLGAATYQTKEGVNLLVESPQSMANRLEAVCWEDSTKEPKSAIKGISYVRVERQGKYLTSSMTEAHRINSPYILEGNDRTFFNKLKKELGLLVEGPINRNLLVDILFRYDIGCLLHGVFLAKKELAGGRLRVSRALSAFIEASGVRQAVSGGVKNDQVNPSGSAKDGFGNVPFSREEYTADRITLYVNIDLAQIRGYGLKQEVEERLLILLALYKLRALVDGDLRLRTACEFEVAGSLITARKPDAYNLPALIDLENDLKSVIAACKDKMTFTTVTFNDELKKAKDDKKDETESSVEEEISGEAPQE